MDDGWLTHKPVYRVPTCCGVLPVESVEHDAAMYGLGFGV